MISIITINLNNAEGLKNTLLSVCDQTYCDVELIVIDGGSTDNSLNILSEFSSKIQYWISEEDSGIYNAMNKGINVSSGSWLMFLNSGDILNGSNALDLFLKHAFEAEMVYCDVLNNVDGSLIKYPDVITFNYFFKFSLNHQSAFFRKELFKKYGNYNESYKIVSDWEYFLRIIFLKNIRITHFGYPIVVFDFNSGISTNSCNQDLIQKERKQVLNDLFPKFIDDYLKLNAYQHSLIIRLVSKLLNKFNWRSGFRL